MEYKKHLKDLTNWMKIQIGIYIANNEEEIRKKIINKFDEIRKKISEIEFENLKIAWNYEEKNCSEYTFEDTVKWAKMNKPNKGVFIVGILKSKNDLSQTLQLHHFFIDSDDNPCLDGSQPHRLVKTKKIDKLLLDQFGDKQILILK